MHIYDLTHLTTNNINGNWQKIPSFKGNITHSVEKVKLNSEEISKISEIFNFYKQLNIIFKAAGDYLNEIFRKNINFLAPTGKSGHILKNVFESNNVKDIKVEKSENHEESIEFTIGENEDAVKVVVSKDQAELFVDDKLSNKIEATYLNEFNTNHDKLFDVTIEKEKEALSLIQKIIKEKVKYDFKLDSPDEMQNVVKRFIDEKKRLALLVDLINYDRFWSQFELKAGETRSLENGTLDGKNVSFRFSQLENSCFDGMQITVTDEINGTKQGFVARTDGEVFKTDVYQKEKFVPRKVWHIRKLTPLTPADYQNSDLNYMFRYAYSHTDRLYRSMLNMFFEDNKINETYGTLSKKKKEFIDKLQAVRLDRIEKFNSRVKKRTEQKLESNINIQNGPLNEDRAKIAKIYKLKQESLDIINQMSEYSNRLSKAYLNRVGYQRDELNKKSGFIRRKSQNGIIFKDILTNKDLLLGLAQYLIKPTSQELISFGIFDKKLTELARFKVATNGEAKLLVRPNATGDFVENIERVLKSEMSKGLSKKLISRLNTAIYYHENKIEVDNYMNKSCHPLTLEQAVKEMITPKENYKFDTNKINLLKNNLDNIKKIYREHQAPAYKWQQIYFPEVQSASQKYMYGRIDKLDINYEFIFVDNEHCSGLRILTRDKNGNFQKGYIIDFQGNANKLIIMPTDGDYRHIYVDKANFSLLDPQAVKEENLDVIFENICKDMEAYCKFCTQCSDEMLTRRQLSRKMILDLAAEYKPETDRLPPKQNLSVKDINESKEPEVPSKNIVRDDTSKLNKPMRQRRNSVRVNKKSEQKIDKVEERSNGKDKNQIETTFQDIKIYDVNPRMLKPNGKFKEFMVISLQDVTEQFDKIFDTPYEERSPHLIHEVLDSGRIFTGRFSVTAPDGARITVSKMKTSEWVKHTYYSIRIQKNSDVVYMDIDPHNGFIIQGEGYISKQDFLKKNPLCAKMPDYFAEIFDYRPNEERKTTKFKVIKTPRMLIEEQAMRDFKKAESQSIPKWMQKECENDFES